MIFDWLLKILGALLMIFAFVVSLGYAIYLWGSLGNDVGYSLWQGFVLWCKMMVSGAFLLLAGVVAEKVFSK